MNKENQNNIILFEDKDNNIDIKYVSFYKRAFAGLIDNLIANFIRIIIMFILLYSYFYKNMVKFQNDFVKKFPNISNFSEEHMLYVREHAIISQTFIFLLIIFFSGAFYHAFFNSSKSCSSIGKYIMNIIMIHNESKPISFTRAFFHYILSLVPFIAIIIIISQIKNINNSSFIEIIFSNIFLIILFFIATLWHYIQLFNKKSMALHDILLSVTFIEFKNKDRSFKNLFKRFK